MSVSNFTFNNKNVIVVGPANNLIGKKKGVFIDSFDIVCRINDSYIISKDKEIDYGKRCDVLFHTCNCKNLCSMNRFRKYLYNCKLIINPTSRIHKQDYNFTKKTAYQNYLDLKLNIPFYQVQGRFESNMNKYGLNTGMCTMDFLLNGTNLKSLYICGLSFYGLKDEENFNKNKIISYNKYLFDYDEVHNCDCSNDKPCKKRIDNKINLTSDENKQYLFFRNYIINNPKSIIDDTILNIYK